MMRRFALALALVTLAVALAAPVRADQTFWKYSSGPTPKHTATPTPNLNGYIYYPCQSGFNPYGGTQGSGQGTKPQHGHGNGYGCSNQRPGPRPSGRPSGHPRPSPRHS